MIIYKYAIGIFSNHATKLDACLYFRDLIRDPDFNLILRDGQTILELQRFEKLKAKSMTIYEASTGHDDKVMSLIWAMYVLKQEYLENYYYVRAYKKNRFGIEVPARLTRDMNGNSSNYFTTEDEFVDQMKLEEKKLDNILIALSSGEEQKESTEAFQ